ncbi:MAG TPA: hypothetical protein VK898_22050 [Chloroflexota bacterium]|nr:hypothetical protein [Chloroflexota bacterium]
MARQLVMSRPVGEVLLKSKLQILNGTGHRRPSIALSILTGRVAEQLSILENFYAAEAAADTEAIDPPVSIMVRRPQRQFAAHTVYLSDAHLQDLDQIIEAWQQVEPRRLTRSAVMRRAVEQLRTTVQEHPAKFMLENE